jgi:hypothetical protein
MAIVKYFIPLGILIYVTLMTAFLTTGMVSALRFCDGYFHEAIREYELSDPFTHHLMSTGFIVLKCSAFLTFLVHAFYFFVLFYIFIRNEMMTGNVTSFDDFFNRRNRVVHCDPNESDDDVNPVNNEKEEDPITCEEPDDEASSDDGDGDEEDGDGEEEDDVDEEDGDEEDDDGDDNVNNNEEPVRFYE